MIKFYIFIFLLSFNISLYLSNKTTTREYLIYTNQTTLFTPDISLKITHVNEPINEKEEIKNYLRSYASNTYNWTGKYFDAIDYIVQKESNYNPTAQNPKSSAYGLFQFLNETWTIYGCKKTSDYKVQIECGLKRIKARYKSPIEAKNFLEKNNWY